MDDERVFSARRGEASRPAAPSGRPIDARELSRLRWRCRRGMLENDLLIERFFARRGVVDEADRIGLNLLMELADNDLLDLFLGRREPAADLDTAEVRQVLAAVRAPQASRDPLSPSAHLSRTLP